MGIAHTYFCGVVNIYMFQHFHLLTLTHRESNLRDIGRLVSVFDPDGNTAVHLQDLKQRQGIDELFYLATCNRITFFFTFRGRVDEDFKVAMLKDAAGQENLLKAMKHYHGEAAINHLMEVGASIDSLVVGERQVLGQIKDAFEKCRACGLTGDDLRVVFDRIIVAGKDVYANTRIGEKSVSIVSLAVRKMMSKNYSKASRVLLVGAGQTNNLVGKFLRKYGYQQVTVFNRSLGRAEKLAKTFEQGSALRLDELSGYAEGFDILFICTAAVEPIITSQNIGTLLNGELASKKLVIDLAVPNNVDEAVAAKAEFSYVAVEHLRAMAEENMAFRTKEIQRAKILLRNNLGELQTEYRQRMMERAMRSFPVEIKAVKQRAIDEVFAKEIETLDPAARDLMDRMMTYMEKKCIGIPMKAAREALVKYHQLHQSTNKGVIDKVLVETDQEIV